MIGPGLSLVLIMLGMLLLIVAVVGVLDYWSAKCYKRTSEDAWRFHSYWKDEDGFK